MTNERCGGFTVPPDLVPALKEFLESGRIVQLPLRGWVCPRCGKTWSPGAKQCNCRATNQMEVK